MSQRTIPGLQRTPRQWCVVCGSPAALYCARCELTPYCGADCQRADWLNRHRAVCHNLVRLSSPHKTMESTRDPESRGLRKAEDISDMEPSTAPMAPLRKPHSPATHSAKREPVPQPKQKVAQAQNNGDGRPTPSLRGHRNNGGAPRQDRRSMNTSRKDENKAANDDQSNFDWKQYTQSPKRTMAASKPVRNETPKEASANKEPAPAIKEPAPVSTAATKSQQETAPEPEAAAPVKTESLPKVKPPGSLSDVLPARKIVPKQYLMETLSAGDTAMLSVDARAADCRTQQAGYVCLSINERSEPAFQRLCDEFAQLCALDDRQHTPSPGECFAYFEAAEDAWYRARCLSAAAAALVDGSRVVPLAAGTRCRALPAGYDAVAEFCCVLQSGNVTLGESLKATLLSKTPTGYQVALENAETSVSLGEGEVSRWLPEVEYPKSVAPTIPDLVRPDVVNNSKVFLVEALSLEKVLVRLADNETTRQFDNILEDIVMYGMKAKPLAEAPAAGSTVLGVYSDGLHYRALCRRTSVKLDKYLLEYAEFGNSEIAHLANLYSCPPELSLSSKPTLVSSVKLQTTANALSDAAMEYLEKIRENNEELLLTITSGAKSGPTGTEVSLVVARNKESLNKKITELCTPDWRKLEESGGDVLNSEVIMDEHLEYLELPADGCELDVLDASALGCGTVSACELGVEHAKYVHGPLTDRMAEYCESDLAKDPYLPKLMEVCIVHCPDAEPQWYRAVLAEHKAGEPLARVCFVDYGHIDSVPVARLRKMLPEFVRDTPALALHVEIKDFPAEPTEAQLARAARHLRLDGAGRGRLRAERCARKTRGVYAVSAPALLAALRDD